MALFDQSHTYTHTTCVFSGRKSTRQGWKTVWQIAGNAYFYCWCGSIYNSHCTVQVIHCNYIFYLLFVRLVDRFSVRLLKKSHYKNPKKIDWKCSIWKNVVKITIFYHSLKLNNTKIGRRMISHMTLTWNNFVFRKLFVIITLCCKEKCTNFRWYRKDLVLQWMLHMKIWWNITLRHCIRQCDN